MIFLGRRELTAIFVGGAAGALLRVWLERHIGGSAPDWPWATFAINLSGAFALGCLTARLRHGPLRLGWLQSLLGPGLCSTYTTFSTMQVELLKMVEDDRLSLAVGYASASVLAGLAAFTLARTFMRRVLAVSV